jgi:hypothetical protein
MEFTSAGLSFCVVYENNCVSARAVGVLLATGAAGRASAGRASARRASAGRASAGIAIRVDLSGHSSGTGCFLLSAYLCSVPTVT